MVTALAGGFAGVAGVVDRHRTSRAGTRNAPGREPGAFVGFVLRPGPGARVDQTEAFSRMWMAQVEPRPMTWVMPTLASGI
jgi:hypothetical protein